MQQMLHIFANHIAFDINGIAYALIQQSRFAKRMRDDGHREARIIRANNR